MSFQAMTWAVEKELPALQKLVLLMLANCCNHHTGRCDPTHERLAKECGMSRTSVKDALRALKERGLIEVLNRSQDGVSLPNQYRLVLKEISTEKEESMGGSPDDRGGDCTEGVGRQTTGGGSPDDRGVGRQATTNQEVKPGSKPKNKKSSLPENFGISESVRAWADEHGYDRLELRLERFIGYVTANGKQYVDWDAAFRNSIRDNWAKLPERFGGGSAGACNPNDQRYVN